VETTVTRFHLTVYDTLNLGMADNGPACQRMLAERPPPAYHWLARVNTDIF